VTNCVEDEKVVENGLSKNLRMGCGFEFCWTNSYIEPRTKDNKSFNKVQLKLFSVGKN
jgi:hypothetical protein